MADFAKKHWSNHPLYAILEKIARRVKKPLPDTVRLQKGETPMRRKLYGNNIQPSCEHCQHGRRSSDGKAILCPKKGVMPLYHHCRRFSYDPLKRIPFRQPALSPHEKEEFRL